MAEARFPFIRKRLRCVRCVNETRKKLKISRNKRKRQPLGMLGRSSGNHGRLRFLRFSFTQAIAFEWKPGLSIEVQRLRAEVGILGRDSWPS